MDQSEERFESFKICNKTRWLSHLRMISSYIKNIGTFIANTKLHLIYDFNQFFTDGINALLVKTRNEQLILNAKQLDTVKELNELLTIFKECVLSLQSRTTPTINLVIPFMLDIKKR